MSRGSEAQHAAARNLIAQMVANSDLHGDDEAEVARQQPQSSQSQSSQPPQPPLPSFSPTSASSSSSIQPGLTAGLESAQAASAARQAALQRRQEAQFGPGVLGGDPDHEQPYRDPVQEALENYGQITDEMMEEWKEMFALFESVNPSHGSNNASVAPARARAAH